MKINFENDFKTWFETIQNILDENVAGNLLNLINENTARIEELESHPIEIEGLKTQVATNTAKITEIEQEVIGAIGGEY